MASSLTPAHIQLAIRASLAATFSIAIARALHLGYPIYAMIGAVIVTDLSVQNTRELGWQRLAGTAVGTSVGAALSYLLPAGPSAIGFGIASAMLLNQLLGLEGTAKLTGYVCGIVLLGFQEHPWLYGLSRFMETALGIGVAWAISFVPKLIHADKPTDSEP